MEEPGGAVGDIDGAPQDVIDFLRACLPFDSLPTAALAGAAAALRVVYHPRGTALLASGAAADDSTGGLHILRSGAVELCDGDGVLIARLAEGETFQLDSGRVVARVIEDALLYRLPAAAWFALRRQHRAFDRFFVSQLSRRLRRAARVSAGPAGTVRDVMSTDLVHVAPADTVRAVAAIMAGRRVSSALVMQGERLVGIVTDRDLRSRVLARGRPDSTPVADVMTPEPATIRGDASLLDATLSMTLREVHHLPVVEDGTLVGMLTSSDLVLARREDPVHLVQHIGRQTDVAGVAVLMSQVPGLVGRWAAADMSPAAVARLLTAISDAVVRRLIALAEADLGSAPAPWAWLAFGSQGRAEQLLGADQDNGIVIADGVPVDDRAWYAQLARRVCDGLAACGFPYCPGGVMATTDAWRAPLAVWRDTVRRWTRSPTPDAVMRVSIFFDPRAVYGDIGLAAALQQDMLAAAGRDTIFLAALAAAVLEARPPLGLFRRFVVERDGAHAEHLDIKKRGVLPITEIVRLHAVACGVMEVNTDERLAVLAQQGQLVLADARNLGDALHCIQRVRLRHQGARTAAGAAPDNHVDPRTLGRLEREQLRDAFTIIHEAQAGVRQRYRAGLG